MEINRVKESDTFVIHGHDRSNQTTIKGKSWAHVVASCPPKPKPKPEAAHINQSTVRNRSTDNRPGRQNRPIRQISKDSGKPVASLKPHAQDSRSVKRPSTVGTEVRTLLLQGEEGCAVRAADLLKQSLDNKQGVTGSTRPEVIKRIKESFYRDLFMDIFNKYQHAMNKKKGLAYVSEALKDCKQDCLRNGYFLFVLRDDYIRTRWLQIATMPWRNSVYEISQRGHFVSEQDIKELCDLIKASPDVSESAVKHSFCKALCNTFDQYKDQHTGFDDKIELLADWVKRPNTSGINGKPVFRQWVANHCAVPADSRNTKATLKNTCSDSFDAESEGGKGLTVESVAINENRADSLPVKAPDANVSIPGFDLSTKGQNDNKTIVSSEIWIPSLVPDIELEYEVYEFDDDRLNQGQRLIVSALAGIEQIKCYQFHSEADKNEWIDRMVNCYWQGVLEFSQWVEQLKCIDKNHLTAFKKVSGGLFLVGGARQLNNLFDGLVDKQKQFAPDDLSVIKDLGFLRDWLLEMHKQFFGNQKPQASIMPLHKNKE